METNPSNRMFSSRPGIGVIHEPSPSLSAPVPTDKKRETRAAPQGHRPDSYKQFPFDNSRPRIGVVHQPSPSIDSSQVADSNEKSSFERPRMGVIHQPSPSINSAQVAHSNEKFSFERPRIGVIHQPSPSIGVQVPPEEKRETAEIDGSSENPNAPIFTRFSEDLVQKTHNVAIGKRQTIEVGPWGGSSSNGWDDGSYTGIRGIGISHGDAIGTLRVVYDLNGETFKGPKHKSRSGYTYNDKIELQFPEEFIVSVNGHTSPLPRLSIETPVVRSLTFKTNKRTFGPYGAEEGTPFNFPIKNGFIVGFQGRSSGQVLNAIGFHLSL